MIEIKQFLTEPNPEEILRIYSDAERILISQTKYSWEVLLWYPDNNNKGK